jgi:hypothetical protein
MRWMTADFLNSPLIAVYDPKANIRKRFRAWPDSSVRVANALNNRHLSLIAPLNNSFIVQNQIDSPAICPMFKE